MLKRGVLVTRMIWCFFSVDIAHSVCLIQYVFNDPRKGNLLYALTELAWGGIHAELLTCAYAINALPACRSPCP